MTGQSGGAALLLFLAPGVGLVPGVWLAPGLSAQEPELIRELPAPVETDPCAGVLVDREAPEAAARDEARGLLQAASEARILGNLERAAELLAEAVALDPTLAEGHLQLARALVEVGQEEGATDAFCRYLALEPQGSDREAVEAAVDRLVPLPEDPLPPSARTAFQEGVALYDAAAYDDAVREFSRALIELPGWAEAHLNRGLAYLAAGREGAGISDLEQYLELRPAGPQSTAVAARVAEAGPPPPSLPSPATALVAGLVPGMGHFYTGDAGLGLLYFVVAGASAATGVFYSRVEVTCLADDVSAGCPPELVADERTERPFLAAGLGAAAGVTVLGAIHAYRRARGRRAAAASGRNGFSVRLGGAPGRAAEVSATPRWDPASGRAGAVLRIRF